MGQIKNIKLHIVTDIKDRKWLLQDLWYLFSTNRGKLPPRLPYLQSSKLPFVLMSFISSTPTWRRTVDNPMLSTSMPVTKRLLNLGVLAVLLLVFLVFEVVVLTALVRLLLVTCVVVDVCLLPPRHGEDGIDLSTKSKEGMPSVLHWQQVQFLPC